MSFVVVLLDGGSEVHRTPVVITVEPADDSGPVFLRPGAGGTFDLTLDPCVNFDIEVRDDDSSSVEIAATTDLPEGADLTQTGPKQGIFEWVSNGRPGGGRRAVDNWHTRGRRPAPANASSTTSSFSGPSKRTTALAPRQPFRSIPRVREN